MIMHVIFLRHCMKIKVAKVAEIVKLLQKHMDPYITKKSIQTSLMKLGM